MSDEPKILVHRFYHEVWNRADEAVARKILHSEFKFRGSLGPERVGPSGFIGYMRSVHVALADYTCEIDHLVTSGTDAAARMVFHGRHQAEFFGVHATQRTIRWAGAAFFETREQQIMSLWVLGDIDSVKAQLGASGQEPF
ncbi:MAG: putative ester cyclase [Alphaproteobacteria bacterium]|jgi:predicted ester cyclase